MRYTKNMFIFEIENCYASCLLMLLRDTKLQYICNVNLYNQLEFLLASSGYRRGISQMENVRMCNQIQV